MPLQIRGSSRTLFLLVLLSLSTLAIIVASTLGSILPHSGKVLGKNNNPVGWKVQDGTQNDHAVRLRVEDIMGAHSSRLTREVWMQRGGSAATPPPIFFLTAARSWGTSSPQVEAVREEQYASNLGGILALGYQVYLAVSPTGGRKWDLVEDLAESAAPGQLRVHYCSNATAVRRRSGGPDEILCMQEAIEHLFEGCILPWEPFTPLLPPPSCCPAPNTHVIRMSGRYLMAKYHLLHAILERGMDVDAFVKWGPRWTESDAIDFPQAFTFFMSMRVRSGRNDTPNLPASCPYSHTHTYTPHILGAV